MIGDERCIKERHFFIGRRLKDFQPLGEIIVCYGWILLATALNSGEEFVGRRRNVPQFDRRAKCPSAKAQRIPLGSGPCAPLDDDNQATLEKLPAEVPLQRLDFGSAFFIVEIDGKGIHPVIWS